MRSKNKRAPTVLEKRWLDLLSQQPCVVCGDVGTEIHEFKQGQWYSAVHLCATCHRDHKRGWHGERLAWTLARMDAMDAVALAVRRNFEAIVNTH